MSYVSNSIKYHCYTEGDSVRPMKWCIKFILNLLTNYIYFYLQFFFYAVVTNLCKIQNAFAHNKAVNC